MHACMIFLLDSLQISCGHVGGKNQQRGSEHYASPPDLHAPLLSILSSTILYSLNDIGL
jgi:hypothetical protein